MGAEKLLKEKMLQAYALSAQIKANGFMNTVRAVAGLNETGAVSLKDLSILASAAIMVLVLVIVFTILPQIGQQVEGAFNQTLTGAWASAPGGAELWTDNAAPIIGICVTLFFVTVLIGYLINLWKNKDSSGGF